MANAKVHDLTGLTTLAALDEIYIVDVSDTTDGADGTSKKYAVGITSGFVGLNDTQTLTLKTLTTPVIASIYQDAAKTKLMTLPDTASDTLVAIAATQTLTNKTLTSPTINTPTIVSPVLNTGLSGTAFLDEDDMASNSATKAASQQSIKAYVDAGDHAVHDSTITFTNKTYVQRIASYTPDAAGTATLDLTTGNIQSITMPAGNITIAISNEAAGQCFLIEILQDAGGSRTVTWFDTIRWVGGAAPTLTATGSKRDVFGFRVTGADTYDGYIVGLNI